MNILVVAAHPDDEVLGVGGTISKYASMGQNVHILILGEGVTSRFHIRNEADPDDLKKMRECSINASKMLGAEDIYFENLPDNRFDSVPLLDLIKVIEKHVERVNPEIIYTHHYGDLNIDHRITFEAVKVATRPLPYSNLKKLLCFEVLSSTEWAVPKKDNQFIPNVFVDISDTIEIKMNAMQIYESEIRDFPHPRSKEGIKLLAKNRGMMVGKEACEAFELIIEVR